MAIVGVRVVVNNTATPLHDNPLNRPVSDPMTASLVNLGPEDVDLGGPDVTTGAGYFFQVGATLDVDLMVNDVLYAVTASGTSTICLLKLRQ